MALQTKIKHSWVTSGDNMKRKPACPFVKQGSYFFDTYAYGKIRPNWSHIIVAIVLFAVVMLPFIGSCMKGGG